MPIGVTFEFVPDPEVHANALLQVDAGLRDRSVPLLTSAQYARESMQQGFLTETDPHGRQWDRWSDKGDDPYENRARRWGNPGILRLGTDITVKGEPRGALELYNYVSDPDHYTIDETAAYFLGGDMPKWGWWHQEGKPGRTTAPSGGMREALAVFGVVGGGGARNPLPKREFIGVSHATRALIYKTFQDWFDKNIQLYYTSTGRLGRRHFIQGEKGRIISRSEAGLPPMPKAPTKVPARKLTPVSGASTR